MNVSTARPRTSDAKSQGVPIGFDFETRTFDFDIANVQSFAQRHVVSYGGNLRYNSFDLSLALGRQPHGVRDLRQDEIFLSDHFRWVFGARWIGSITWTLRVLARTTFMIKPMASQTIGVYNARIARRRSSTISST